VSFVQKITACWSTWMVHSVAINWLWSDYWKQWS